MTDYTLVRSSRRTVALEVTADGSLLVRAPRRMPRREIEAFVAAKAEWVASARVRQQRRMAARDGGADDAALRARAEAELPPRLLAWAERMCLGEAVASVRISSAKKRLGSCAVGGDIRLSYHLLRWPDAVVEYVLVHELAHLRHHDHSPAFYAEIERHLPDYKNALAILRGRT